MTRVRLGLARVAGGAKASAVIAAPPNESGQLLGHVKARMAGRLTRDPGSDLPALFEVETRRLKVECRQYRAGTAASPRFFFCHGQDPAAKSVAPQILRQEKPFDRQQ